MVERTEGHQPQSGHGPQPLAVLSGMTLEGRAQAAYRAYVEHAHDCDDCRRAAFQCDRAAALWQVYREARAISRSDA